MTTGIDTLQLYERFRAADLPDKAAKEIAEAIKDTVEERLVTKEYLDIRLKEIESSIKADIVKWVAGMIVAQTAVLVTLIKLIK
jgi:hypothetical protein